MDSEITVRSRFRVRGVYTWQIVDDYDFRGEKQAQPAHEANRAWRLYFWATTGNRHIHEQTHCWATPHTSERLLWLAFICGKLGRAVNFFRSGTIRQSQNSKELGRPFTNRQLNLVIATVGLLNFMNGI